MWCLVVGRTKDAMPEQRKRLHCVAEIALSTTFLHASEVPAIGAFARSGLPTMQCHARELMFRYTILADPL